MIRIPDIPGGFADIWRYIREDRPHRLPALALSLVLSVVLIYLFGRSFEQEPDRTPDIVYFETWSADRSDAESQADWLERAKETNERNARRRAAYQALAEGLGIDYDASEAEQISAETDATVLPPRPTNEAE